jgi:flagellar biogenesis protein FliO
MLPNAVFSLADASPEQVVAFVGSVIFTIGFFVWVAYLVRMK